jgi:hypothetical protein
MEWKAATVHTVLSHTISGARFFPNFIIVIWFPENETYLHKHKNIIFQHDFGYANLKIDLDKQEIG